MINLNSLLNIGRCSLVVISTNLLFSLIGFGQESESLHAADAIGVIGNNYYQSGDFQKAAEYYLRALDLTKPDRKEDIEVRLYCLSNLGSVYRELGQHEEEFYWRKEVNTYCESQYGELNPRCASYASYLALVFLNTNDYLSAFDLLQPWSRIPENDIPDEFAPEMAILYYNLSRIAGSLGRFEDAEKAAHRCLKLRESTFGKNSVEYARAQEALGLLHLNSGDYMNADLALKSALLILRQLGVKDHRLLVMLNAKAKLSLTTGDLNEAENCLREALDITLESYDSAYSGTAMLFSQLATLYRAKSQYERSVEYFELSIETNKNAKDGSAFFHGVYTIGLGSAYGNMNDYGRASTYLQEGLTIIEQTAGKVNQQFIGGLGNLADVQSQMGEFAQAKELYMEAMRLQEQFTGKSHLDFARLEAALGSVYANEGNYAEARKLYLLAKNRFLETVGSKNEDYAGILSKIATLNRRSGGSPVESLYSYEEAFEIEKALIGEDHIHNLITLGAIGNTLSVLDSLDEANAALEKALNGIEKIVGRAHSEWATVGNNLAVNLMRQQRHEEALTLFDSVLVARTKLFGEINLLVASCKSNIARTHLSLGHYNTALKNFSEAMDIVLEIGENDIHSMSEKERQSFVDNEMDIHFNIFRGIVPGLRLKNSQTIKKWYDLEIFRNQFVLNSMMGMRASVVNNPDTSIIQLYDNWLKASLELSSLNPPVLDNGVTFIGIGVGFEIANDTTIITGIFPNGPADNTRLSVGDKILSIEGTPIAGKGMNLQQVSGLMKGKENTDVEFTFVNGTSGIIEDIIIQRKMIDTRSPYTKLKEKVEAFEGQLAHASKDFALSRKQVTWDMVRDELSEDEAAIEFSSFQYIDSLGNWTDSTLYTALILRSGDTCPRMVTLFEQRQLDALTEMETDDRQRIALLYRGAVPVAEQTTNYGNELYELVWAPLEEHLQGARKIHFSPSGSLHHISFSALPISEDSLLMDRYELNRVGSTAAITFEREERPPSDIVLFGGMDYSMDTTQLQALAQNISTKNIRSRGVPADLSRGNEEWSDLPGTRQEVEGITRIAKDKGVRTTAYLGEEAIEERYKNLGGKNSPTVLHIATHGFFFPDPEKKQADRRLNGFMEDRPNVYKASDDPMNRSGILFSGANASWTGNEPTTAENGILTAREATYVPLINTELVVLSACETGLGEIKGSEGVFGLQRAFKAAGAEYLLMSLWKVPDQETSEFMESFYGHYLSDHTIPDSYHHAQRVMRNKYPNDPYKWAGFVLMR